MSSQPNDNGSSIGQSDLRSNFGPATQRWALEMKEEKNASKEALDATAFAKFFLGPVRRQTGTVLLVFGIPRDDRYSTKYGMNPGNEAQTPIGCMIRGRIW